MLLDLDDPRATDPLVAGAKAAWLAVGRRAGLPILPGCVVPADASLAAMAAGAEALAARGSGGARLVVRGLALDASLLAALERAVGRLGGSLVVRSSPRLEASGAFAGAFTSYVGIAPAELPTAVRGCWASAFGVATLERLAATGHEPGATPMALLVQPALTPQAGGAAWLEAEDVVVAAVAGSPAALLQGWEPGVHGRVGRDGTVRGDELLGLVGPDAAAELADSVREAERRTGATRVEWALDDGRVWLLQLAHAPAAEVRALDVPKALRSPKALAIGRLVRRAPGPLGEAWVLPWAMADPDPVATALDRAARAARDDRRDVAAGAAMALAAVQRLAAELTAAAWAAADARDGRAADDPREVLRALRGPEPEAALARCAALPSPDAERVARFADALEDLLAALDAAGAVDRTRPAWALEPEAIAALVDGTELPRRIRAGPDRWEPFTTAQTLATGAALDGVAAAGGRGAGRLRWIEGADSPLAARDVVVVVRPLPHVAPMLWDAAGLVAVGGGPAAHLFESARALGVPAVAGVGRAAVPENGDEPRVIAVDGEAGRVAVAPW